jgi:hypothetical protein
MTQKKGMVTIIWMLNSHHSQADVSENNPGIGKSALTIGPFLKAFPIRSSGMHFCFSDTSFQSVMNFTALVMERAARVRVRAHSGKRILSFDVRA